MPPDATAIKAIPATLESDDDLDSWAASALVVVGFALSFFFREHFGNETIVFCVALALPLLVAMAVAFARIRRVSAMDFPAAAMPVTLLWMWISVSLLWSRAPRPGLLASFAVSGLPLGFWVYLMAPNREQMARLLAGLPVLAALMAQTLFGAEKRPRRIAILSCSLLLMVATVVLSASRSALLAAVPGILIVAGFCWKRAVEEGRRMDCRYVVAVIVLP